MTKDVLLRVKGLQYELLGQGQGDVETITPAEYYRLDGVHYILFDEVASDSPLPIKNQLKIGEDYLELSKKGAVNVDMIFEEKKKSLSNYSTPFGEVTIGVDTGAVRTTEDEKQILVEVDYRLDVNYVYMADCKISALVTSRATGLSLIE